MKRRKAKLLTTAFIMLFFYGIYSCDNLTGVGGHLPVLKGEISLIPPNVVIEGNIVGTDLSKMESSVSNLSLQWQFSEDGETWIDIPGETTRNFYGTRDYLDKALRVRVWEDSFSGELLSDITRVETSQSYQYIRINWYTFDGNLITSSDVISGYAFPKPPTPTVPEDTDEWDYGDFAGWAESAEQESGIAEDALPETVTEGKNYYAAFARTKKSYTVTFLNYDGSALSDGVQTVEYGVVPSYSGTPSRPGDSQVLAYIHAGWTTEQGGTTVLTSLPMVTANTTYYAYFTESSVNYIPEWPGW